MAPRPKKSCLLSHNLTHLNGYELHMSASYFFPSYGVTHCPTIPAPPVLSCHRSPAWGSRSRSDLGPALPGKATIGYPQKKRTRIVSPCGIKTVRLRFPLGIHILKGGHGETLLGSLVVTIAALGSYIVTTTHFPLPGPTCLGMCAPSVCRGAKKAPTLLL